MQTDHVSKKSTVKNQIPKFNLSQTKSGMISSFLFLFFKLIPLLVLPGPSMQQKSKKHVRIKTTNALRNLLRMRGY